MRLTKRQLKKIIREEKEKLLKEGLPERPVPYRMREDLDQAFSDFSKNLEGVLGMHDSKWWENASVLALLHEMLDDMKGNYRF